MSSSIKSSIKLVAAQFVANANNIRSKGDERSVGELVACQVNRAGEQCEFDLDEIMCMQIHTHKPTTDAVNLLNSLIGDNDDDEDVRAYDFNYIFTTLRKILTDDFGVDPEDLEY
jgi:hypothetical protein